jgi:hypothetical protein
MREVAMFEDDDDEPAIPPSFEPTGLPDDRVPGVSQDRCGRWEVRMNYSGCRVRVGSFDTFEDAVHARKAAEAYKLACQCLPAKSSGVSGIKHIPALGLWRVRWKPAGFGSYKRIGLFRNLIEAKDARSKYIAAYRRGMVE